MNSHITVNGRPLGSTRSPGHLRALARSVIGSGAVTDEWQGPGPVLKAAGLGIGTSNRKLLKAALETRPDVEIRALGDPNGGTRTEYRRRSGGPR